MGGLSMDVACPWEGFRGFHPQTPGRGLIPLHPAERDGWWVVDGNCVPVGQYGNDGEGGFVPGTDPTVFYENGLSVRPGPPCVQARLCPRPSRRCLRIVGSARSMSGEGESNCKKLVKRKRRTPPHRRQRTNNESAAPALPVGGEIFRRRACPPDENFIPYRFCGRVEDTAKSAKGRSKSKTLIESASARLQSMRISIFFCSSISSASSLSFSICLSTSEKRLKPMAFSLKSG